VENVNNFSATLRDSIFRYIQPRMETIFSTLAVSSVDEIAMIQQPEWCNEFVSALYKYKFFSGNANIINNTANSVANSLVKKIEYVNTCPVGTLDNEFIFKDNGKIGEWRPDSNNYFFIVKLIGLSSAFVVAKEHSTINNYRDYIQFILYPKEKINELVTFLQNEDVQSGGITVNIVGQGTCNVKRMGWDNIILDESVDFLVRKDIDSFMGRKQWYKDKGIPYRRGYLFHGPPGNGKTTVIRAMLTHTGLPGYTIKRMHDSDAMYYFDDMFAEAAKSGCAIIILEDIDRTFAEKSESVESSSNAIPFSVFLNNLDGIAEADGIIVVATANTPQVLDKAILERPGRFDRVVGFENPGLDLRKRYVKFLAADLSDEQVITVATHCADISFAQLREVYILAVQIADSKSVELSDKDMIESCDRLNSYIRKAGGKTHAGFKS
jgi:hypothetical protein